MKLPDWFAPAIFLAALAAALHQTPLPPVPAFAPLPPPAPAAAKPSRFASEALPTVAPSAHAATLAELADGRLAAAWFAGSREGAADVSVWLSLRDAQGWSEPRPVATREGTAADTRTHVRKLGNPVLQADGGRLHLWYVSVGIGGWAGSALNHRYSDDGGATWTPARRLVTSPLFNLSTLVRTPAVRLADGGLGLPVYHEFLARHGEWLRLDGEGRLLDKKRLPQSVAALQPAVVALGERKAVAFLRNADASPDKTVLVARTADGGDNWQEATATAIGNPNSSVAAVRLPSGALVLAGNPKEGRSILNLWLSEDEGRSWRLARTVESSPDDGGEFSYPALLLTRDDRVHLAYTWRREGIRHAVFTETWLREGLR